MLWERPQSCISGDGCLDNTSSFFCSAQGHGHFFCFRCERIECWKMCKIWMFTDDGQLPSFRTVLHVTIHDQDGPPQVLWQIKISHCPRPLAHFCCGQQTARHTSNTVSVCLSRNALGSFHQDSRMIPAESWSANICSRPQVTCSSTQRSTFAHREADVRVRVSPNSRSWSLLPPSPR